MKKTVFISMCLFFFAAVVSLPSAPPDAAQDSLSLKNILTNTEKYCKRLREAAFHFLCKETVTEISGTKEFFKKYGGPGYALKSAETKNKYVNDYRIIKEGDKVTEWRKNLLHNGKKVTGTTPAPKTTIASFKSTLSPYYLFAGGNRKRYRYRLLEKEKVMNRPAHVIRVDVKKGSAPFARFALVWVDVSDFSILKLHAFPESIKGYENLKRSGKHDIRDVRIEDIHYYDYKEKGLRFPSKADIFLTYTYDSPRRFEKQLGLSAGARMLKTVKTTFAYKKYIFFTVTVTEPIIH